MAVANTHPILTGLLAQQQGTHQGAPGGLGNPLDANERAILLKHESQFKPVTFRKCCSVAPDHIDAHDKMAKHIGKLASRLLADDDVFYLFLQKQNIAYGRIPTPRYSPARKEKEVLVMMLHHYSSSTMVVFHPM
jgi:hypothetical protein